MKKVKILCLICCLSMMCSITSFAKDISKENKADLLAAPRYFHQWEQIVQNGTGFMVRNHEYNSPFLLLPNMSYSLKLNGKVKDYPNSRVIHNVMITVEKDGTGESVNTIFLKEYTLGTPIEITVPEMNYYELSVLNLGLDTWLLHSLEFN